MWTTLFLFFRLLASMLVDGLQHDERWRLIDLWNNLRLVGYAALGIDPAKAAPAPQPPAQQPQIPPATSEVAR